jgi:hypothetical protein
LDRLCRPTRIGLAIFCKLALRLLHHDFGDCIQVGGQLAAAVRIDDDRFRRRLIVRDRRRSSDWMRPSRNGYSEGVYGIVPQACSNSAMQITNSTLRI